MLNFVCMKIALITGGSTGESEVSLLSARSIEEALHFAEVDVFVFPNQLQDFLSVHDGYDLAIPMIHGKGGEDGSLHGLLEQLSVPHLFGNIKAHAIGIDKELCKRRALELGIKSPQTFVESSVAFPVFVKSNTGGSSLQMGLCDDQDDLGRCLSSGICEPLIEEVIVGREFTVGVIEQEGEMVALPVVEIIPKSAYFDYESKYDEKELAEEICPAVIEEELKNELQRQAVMIHESLGVEHLSRSDFIVTDQREIYFLEINTIPGMTKTSLVPKALEVAGVDLSALLLAWCDKLKSKN